MFSDLSVFGDIKLTNLVNLNLYNRMKFTMCAWHARRNERRAMCARYRRLERGSNKIFGTLNVCAVIANIMIKHCACPVKKNTVHASTRAAVLADDGTCYELSSQTSLSNTVTRSSTAVGFLASRRLGRIDERWDTIKKKQF
jgi:hypothetical protein